MRGVFMGALILLFALDCALAQTGDLQTHTTIRRHRVAVEQSPPEIAEAENAIQKNDFAGAETLLERALQKDPKNYQAWFDLAFVQNKLGKSSESIHAYRQAVAAKPDVFESNLNLGLMLARENSPEAEHFLRAAATLKPTDHVEEGQARAWLSLGHIIERRNPDEALEAYQKAAALTPKDPEPHLSAGLLRERRKDFAGAETEYKQVLALAPQSSDAVIGLTNLYMKSGRVAEAEPLLRQLASQRPDDADLHLQLGRVLATQQKNDDAIAELETALKLVPSDQDAQRELSDLYAASGKQDKAEAMYRSLLQGNPKDAALHRGLGQALLRQKKFPEAQQEFLTAVQLKSDWPDLYVDLAVAASENQNYPLTIKALDQRSKFQPEMPAVCYFFRASAYDHLRAFKEAAADYRLFLEGANGKYPDQEWQARHRLIAIEPKKR